ncbi:MAG: hypothetical protein V8T87_12895 [Victivallales bacterium]
MSSAFAAAAALKTEYTMPGLSMSAIYDARRGPDACAGKGGAAPGSPPMIARCAKSF